jgi:hypothetical protein
MFLITHFGDLHEFIFLHFETKHWNSSGVIHSYYVYLMQ